MISLRECWSVKGDLPEETASGRLQPCLVFVDPHRSQHERHHPILAQRHAIVLPITGENALQRVASLLDQEVLAGESPDGLEEEERDRAPAVVQGVVSFGGRQNV